MRSLVMRVPGNVPETAEASIDRRRAVLIRTYLRENASERPVISSRLFRLARARAALLRGPQKR